MKKILILYNNLKLLGIPSVASDKHNILMPSLFDKNLFSQSFGRFSSQSCKVLGGILKSYF